MGTIMHKGVNYGGGGLSPETEEKINEIDEKLTQTPVEMGEEILSTIDDKLNYILQNSGEEQLTVTLKTNGSITAQNSSYVRTASTSAVIQIINSKGEVLLSDTISASVSKDNLSSGSCSNNKTYTISV